MTAPDRPTLTLHDEREKWRCPQLGGPVHFEYCRRMNRNLPCHQLYKCWSEEFDVDDYVKQNFTEEEIVNVFHTPPLGRVGTIFDVLRRVEEAKKKQ
ncbi:MAG: hypothetical protein C4527_26270 [Candidatus Omnitrophota bacterium]|jgi:hypothetical protein|nr:MAG: hypothetical protein C4527_26270 [Candidatus Omnitrophota bacterium]